MTLILGCLVLLKREAVNSWGKPRVDAEPVSWWVSQIKNGIRFRPWCGGPQNIIICRSIPLSQSVSQWRILWISCWRLEAWLPVFREPNKKREQKGVGGVSCAPPQVSDHSLQSLRLAAGMGEGYGGRCWSLSLGEGGISFPKAFNPQPSPPPPHAYFLPPLAPLLETLEAPFAKTFWGATELASFPPGTLSSAGKAETSSICFPFSRILLTSLSCSLLPSLLSLRG